MAAPVEAGYREPRWVILFDELDIGLGKGGKQIRDAAHLGYVSYGLWVEDDATLDRWRAVLIGPQGGNLGERIYTIELVCPQEYPQRAPVVRRRHRQAPCLQCRSECGRFLGD